MNFIDFVVGFAIGSLALGAFMCWIYLLYIFIKEKFS